MGSFKKKSSPDDFKLQLGVETPALQKGTENIFCHGSDSKYSRFCRPYDVGCTLQLCHHSIATDTMQTSEHSSVSVKLYL